jgi:hypothetical protein
MRETRNKSKRYFARLDIVYIPEIYTYVLTNKRRYVYVAEIDTHMLNQSLKYKILNFCPFCGKDLSNYRIDLPDKQALIVKYIKRWRETTSPYVKTKIGFDCYDCFYYIASTLVEAYCRFDNTMGTDPIGNIYRGACFITIDKIFTLIAKCELKYCYDGERKDFMQYFINNFQKHIDTPDDDKVEFKSMVDSVLWLIFHNEKNSYNCLMEMQ